MALPTVEGVRALHEKYAPTRDALGLVYTHCEIVCRIAEQLMARTAFPLDRDLVRLGAMLHDIGVYRLYDRTGRSITSPRPASVPRAHRDRSPHVRPRVRVVEELSRDRRREGAVPVRRLREAGLVVRYVAIREPMGSEELMADDARTGPAVWCAR